MFEEKAVVVEWGTYSPGEEGRYGLGELGVRYHEFGGDEGKVAWGVWYLKLGGDEGKVALGVRCLKLGGAEEKVALGVGAGVGVVGVGRRKCGVSEILVK